MVNESSPPVSGTPVNLQLAPMDYYQRDDEISLYDIVQSLFKHKFHIAVITVLCTGMAALYAILAAPRYEAEIYISYPAQRDVQGLKAQDFTPASAFQAFTDTFYSRALRWQYFNDHKLWDELVDDDAVAELVPATVFEKQFNNFFSYTRVVYAGNRKNNQQKEKQAVRMFRTALQAPEAELAAEWLNGFVELASKQTIFSIKHDVEADLTYQMQAIEDEMAGLRALAEKTRLDQIGRLSEADNIQRTQVENEIRAAKDRTGRGHTDRLAILRESLQVAKTLGIVDLNLISPDEAVKNTGSPVGKGGLDGLLYTRGVSALTAEIDAVSARAEADNFVAGLRGLQQQLQLLEENPTITALQNRQSDDAHIENLRTLEKQHAALTLRLQQLMADTSIKAVTIEQYATPPQERIKPKRTLIVGIGFVAGLMG